MMRKILVEVGYLDFYFEDMEEAVAFAWTAATHAASEDSEVTLSVKFIKEEEVENGSNEED